MSGILKWLAAPGARRAVTKTAPSVFPLTTSETTEKHVPTQSPVDISPALVNELKVIGVDGQGQEHILELPEQTAQTIDEEKSLRLDRWLDRAVSFAGSPPVLLLTFALVILWALLGIRFGNDTDWQVVISDVQALVCYVLDSLLMRQQLNAYNREIAVAATMQSRSASVRRMLATLLANEEPAHARAPVQVVTGSKAGGSTATSRPTRSWIYAVTNAMCSLFGSLPTLMLFWVCIFIWLGFGPYCSWSANWQLYINSATSALMLLVFILLTSVQEQHRRQLHMQITSTCMVDADLERRLRLVTGDAIPNSPAIIAPGPVGHLERAISYYADLVGTLVGILLLCVVLAVWIAIGPALQFSSNWWLIIGTYAGLIGLHDGFVLHNVRSQLDRHSRAAFGKIAADDAEALALVGLPAFEASGSNVVQYDDVEAGRISVKCSGWPASQMYARVRKTLSSYLSHVMSHRYSVLAGIMFVVGSVIGATALHWSLTGQLLCNVPPSIIETFVMMALITREQEDADAEKLMYDAVGQRREFIMAWLDARARDVAEELSPAQA